jgi:arginine decarboxylase
MARWSPQDGAELYQIPAWGKGWFEVNAQGHLGVRPPGKEQLIDLHMLVEDLRLRGIALPMLVRFPELIEARIAQLVTAFQVASAEYGFKGLYRGVYPIKVNQDKFLVDAVVAYSRPHHLGLEAGSKPELQVVLATLEDPEALIICNGYKDRSYIQMALLARKLGRNCIVVIEKMDELDRVLEVAKELRTAPVIGIRAKLSAKGSGRWQSSGGDRAKFGLTIKEMVTVVERLKEEGMLDILQLLHFHIGSQVTNIRSIHKALREATRLYTELTRLGAAMKYLDVGGGLGVDYDGSRTNFESSMNYDVQEYASAVVAAVTEGCDEAGVAHPHLITEAGRALVAYSSALIFDVLGVTKMVTGPNPTKPHADADAAIVELYECWQGVNAKNLQEPLHDATDIRDEALVRFGLGLLSLEERAEIEGLYWQILEKLSRVAARAEYVPEELEPLKQTLADTYYCNFSLFQSAPDSWAINQLFPICPIHRLHEEPHRQAVLADLTCDSDGVVKRFIDRRDVKTALEVHELRPGEPYYLGMFLIGAYQEILGDLHNLFGDTNVALVSAAANERGYKVDQIVEGNTIREVLDYVSYDRKRLLGRLRGRVEEAIAEGRLSSEEGGLLVNTYIQGLESYTYLT